MDKDHGINLEIVEWLDKAIEAYYKNRTQSLLGQIGTTQDDSLVPQWNALLEDMHGFDDKGKKKDQSFKEAKKAGEVYGFKREKRAEKFADYGYKKGKARREAKREYKMNKKNK